MAGTRLLSTHHRKLSTCAASRGCCFQSSNLICKASCTKYTSRTGWKCCGRPLRQVLHSWSSRPDKRLNLRKGSEGKNKAEMAGALPLQVIWALHGPSSACRSLQATALSPTTLNQNVSLLKCLGSSEKHNQNHLGCPKFAVLKMLKLHRTVALNLPSGPPALRLWTRHLADVLHAVRSVALPTTTRKCCVNKP